MIEERIINKTMELSLNERYTSPAKQNMCLIGNPRKMVSEGFFLELKVKEGRIAWYILYAYDFCSVIFCVLRTGSCFIAQIGMELVALVLLIQTLEF